METLMQHHMVNNILSEFDELSKWPEIYIAQHTENAEKFKKLTKTLYDFAVSANGLNGLQAKSLSKLFIKGFDEEQIWQQIELQNKSAASFFSKEILAMKPEDISFVVQNENASSLPVLTQNNEVIYDSSSAGEEEYAFDDDSDSSSELPNITKKKLPPTAKKCRFNTEVDDQFFKLSELEQFLKIEDLKEEKGVTGDDEIYLFEDIPSDSIEDLDDGSEDDKKLKKSSKDLMYEDFFDAPESGDESVNDEYEDMKENKTNEDSGSDVDMNEDSDEENMQNSEDKQSAQKTAFELEQEKIKKKIEECEKNMVKPLPWQLTGEVAANNRPVDSLVHEQTEFDSNAKQELIVDNAFIENITIMTAVNKAYCSVERKFKPTDELITSKKQVDLDQTKSKKSLAEIYEDDYLKKQSKQEEEEDPQHKKIKSFMDSLFPELFAMYTYIPKPAIPELKVVSNLPAVTVEEVAPTSVSDVTMLAPEEVKARSGVVKGKTERTDTDRKHERRKKKLHQKFKEKKKLEKLELLKKRNPSAKATKLEKAEAMKKLKQHKNTKIANVDEGSKIKSSKDFFSRLQDTVDSNAKTKNKFSSKKKKN